MYKTFFRLGLSGIAELDELLLCLVAYKFKLMTVERGTYNYRFSESAILNVFKAFLGYTAPFSTPNLVNDFLPVYRAELEKLTAVNFIQCSVEFGYEVHLMTLNSAERCDIFTSIVAEKLSRNTTFLNDLGLSLKDIDKHRIKVFGNYTKGNKKYVKVMSCKSFDDLKTIYTDKEIIWEDENHVYVEGYPLVYK